MCELSEECEVSIQFDPGPHIIRLGSPRPDDRPIRSLNIQLHRTGPLTFVNQTLMASDMRQPTYCRLGKCLWVTEHIVWYCCNLIKHHVTQSSRVLRLAASARNQKSSPAYGPSSETPLRSSPDYRSTRRAQTSAKAGHLVYIQVQ